MHGTINVKSPNNTSKWQMGFNSAFKGLKWRHVSTQGVIIRPIIEPCLRYIKWKCTFLGIPKMFITAWQRGYNWGWYLQYIAKLEYITCLLTSNQLMTACIERSSFVPWWNLVSHLNRSDCSKQQWPMCNAQSERPPETCSSVLQNCVYSNGICQTSAVYAVLSSWWWTERPSETCGRFYKNK